jgi:NAD(P)-dependent dehydrogenase (short-subunit alcohol dehydrogenase family)
VVGSLGQDQLIWSSGTPVGLSSPPKSRGVVEQTGAVGLRSDHRRRVIWRSAEAAARPPRRDIPIAPRDIPRTLRGSIVNAVLRAVAAETPNMSVYAASKHAVEGLTRSAALELAKDGIRVNVVLPDRRLLRCSTA